MHQQIRMVVPTGSPRNVATPLGVLKRAGISLIAAGGSNVEYGGELAVSVNDDQIERAAKLLEEFGPRIVDVKVCWLTPNGSGELLGCIEQARHDPKFVGKQVRDITVTTEHDAHGRVGVQVYFDDPEAAE